MRRLTVLPVLAVIVWSMALVVRSVSELAHDRGSPGVVITLVALAMFVLVCVRISVGLWRRDEY